MTPNRKPGSQAQDVRRLSHDRERMLEIAAPVLHDHPAATLESVAAAAGLSEQTAHQLFATRDQLVDEICARAIGELTRAVARSETHGGTGLRAVADLGAAAVVDAPIWTLLPTQTWDHTSHAGVTSGIARLTADVSGMLEDAFHAGELRSGMTPQQARESLSVVLAPVRSAWSNGEATSAEAAVAARHAIFTGLGRTDAGTSPTETPP